MIIRENVYNFDSESIRFTEKIPVCRSFTLRVRQTGVSGPILGKTYVCSPRLTTTRALVSPSRLSLAHQVRDPGSDPEVPRGLGTDPTTNTIAIGDRGHVPCDNKCTDGGGKRTFGDLLS